MSTSEYHHQSAFDSALNQLPHYDAYPRMSPFVGRLYGQHGPKILLVAESHYLPKESSCHLDARRWYAGSEKDLSSKDKPGWIHTQKIIDKENGKWTARGHEIYRRLNRALSEAGYSGGGNMFRYVAYMNGFQRPAVTGKSLDVQREDLEVARQTLNGVIDIIKPECVIFVSTKAKKYLGKHLSIESKGVPHPACGWWYRTSKYGTGKERFINLMSGLYAGVGAD